MANTIKDIISLILGPSPPYTLGVFLRVKRDDECVDECDDECVDERVLLPFCLEMISLKINCSFTCLDTFVIILS